MSHHESELSKDLGLAAALTIGIGTMIGAGIFVLPGTAIERAGWHAVLSFVIGGGIAILTAFSASELGTAMPRSGGAYYYVNRALGPLFGSIAGWANWLGLAFASAFYMVGFGEYVRTIFGLGGAIGVGPVTLSVVKVLALFGATLFVLVNYVGARETGSLQNVIVAILVGILAVVTVVGAFSSDPANLPAGKGLTPTLTTTGLIFVSFLGFVQITSVAEEVKNPDRNLPRAIIGSVVIVTVIYALVLITMAAAVEPGFIAEQQLAGNIAVVEIGRRLLGPAGAIALLVGGLLATASSANASILASSRINFAMGRDRLISPKLNEVHYRFNTPYRAIAITGGLILLFIVIGNVELLATLGSVLHLIIYALLNIGLIVFREANVADYDPSYTVPLYPFTPIAGALTSLGLIVFIEPKVVGFSAVLVLGAVTWYFAYAQSRTTVRGALSDFISSQEEEMPDSVVSAATSLNPEGGEFKVMVPLANPAHEQELITLAAAIAKARGGTVDAVHIISVPEQTSLQYAAEHFDAERDRSESLLESAKTHAEELGVPVETATVFSHRTIQEGFDLVGEHDADLVVMGWGPESHHPTGRVEGTLDEVFGELPADFLVFKDRGFDPSSLLVPTAGGPDSALSAEIAKDLRSVYDSDITLLHVADEPTEGRDFLEAWASDHDLEDVAHRVETGPVEPAIVDAAEDASLVISGASERGLLSQLVGESPVSGLVRNLDCSMISAERAQKRGFFERLRDRLL
ncbi:MAG: amino acid permease [Halodesulfurarchaeum sp.]|nr:amino acid permease [Halodesulfurarchaeum sp.]